MLLAFPAYHRMLSLPLSSHKIQPSTQNSYPPHCAQRILNRNTSTMARLHTFLFCLSLIFPQCYASCYFPNGASADILDDLPLMQPCNETPGVQSMCCMTQTIGVFESCNADNLCVNDENTVLAQGTCTDETWRDPACLNLCISGESELCPSPSTVKGGVPRVLMSC